ncbi:TIM barrel protein [Martelella alba]|uniref:TIM barrel protein n=1 Tax=Martelella alba TaxID=2590451 RepID=A0ABY2SEQ1_9HYPH|nr:TIM barrel protein [Martelella alba]TKI03006.1 TIM barrel protein [Martelella alba]
MTINIANAPCSWGVDDPRNPYLPPYKKVLQEASLAGYTSIELGPWTYFPTDPEVLTAALHQYHLSIVAGTIFDDLVSEDNFPNLIFLTHSICRNLSRIPTPEKNKTTRFSAPYLVLIDFGNPQRARFAGHPDISPRLATEDWYRMITHIKHIAVIAWNEYNVRPVIHPHAGGCIEFADEIDRLANDIPYTTAGLCLDTGHLYYSGMDPAAWLVRYFSRLDYLHFKDVNKTIQQDALNAGLDFFTAAAAGAMCPLGQGSIDYPSVRKILKEKDYQGWVTIEQERDPRNVGGSLGDVMESLRYLQTMGF